MSLRTQRSHTRRTEQSSQTQRSPPALLAANSRTAGNTNFERDFSGVRVQRQPKPKGDPLLEARRIAFQKSLGQSGELEKINGPIARAIAHAYVHRTMPLRATQSIDDRVQRGPAQVDSEEFVYASIVQALDVTKSGKTLNASEWKWRPLTDPNKGKRDDALTEIGLWAADEYLGGTTLKDIAIDKAKDFASEYSAKWLAKRGLVVTARMFGPVGAVISAFELAFSLSDLMKTLKKPLKRPLYRNEIILRDVMAWLDDGSKAKEEAEKNAKEAAEAKQALDHPSIRVMVPDKLRVGR